MRRLRFENWVAATWKASSRKSIWGNQLLLWIPILRGKRRRGTWTKKVKVVKWGISALFLTSIYISSCLEGLDEGSKKIVIHNYDDFMSILRGKDVTPELIGNLVQGLVGWPNFKEVFTGEIATADSSVLVALLFIVCLFQCRLSRARASTPSATTFMTGLTSLRGTFLPTFTRTTTRATSSPGSSSPNSWTFCPRTCPIDCSPWSTPGSSKTAS